MREDLVYSQEALRISTRIHDMMKKKIFLLCNDLCKPLDKFGRLCYNHYQILLRCQVYLTKLNKKPWASPVSYTNQTAQFVLLIRGNTSRLNHTYSRIVRRVMHTGRWFLGPGLYNRRRQVHGPEYQEPGCKSRRECKEYRGKFSWFVIRIRGQLAELM